MDVFKVTITEPAEQDIENAFVWWAENRSEEQAVRWYREIKAAIKTLRRMPARCPIVPETGLSVDIVHQLLFGVGNRPTHRIIFTIDAGIVSVLRVRHYRQDELGPGEYFG